MDPDGEVSFKQLLSLQHCIETFNLLLDMEFSVNTEVFATEQKLL